VQHWNDNQKALLAEKLTFAASMQKVYGQKVNIIMLVEGFSWVLGSKYTVAQVIDALQVYMQNNEDLPTPAAIADIINPPAPKVTYAEYSHAIKLRDRDRLTFERQGWSQVINDYHNQKDPLND